MTNTVAIGLDTNLAKQGADSFKAEVRGMKSGVTELKAEITATAREFDKFNGSGVDAASRAIQRLAAIARETTAEVDRLTKALDSAAVPRTVKLLVDGRERVAGLLADMRAVASEGDRLAVVSGAMARIGVAATQAATSMRALATETRAAVVEGGRLVDTFARIEAVRARAQVTGGNPAQRQIAGPSAGPASPVSRGNVIDVTPINDGASAFQRLREMASMATAGVVAFGVAIGRIASGFAPLQAISGLLVGVSGVARSFGASLASGPVVGMQMLGRVGSASLAGLMAGFRGAAIGAAMLATVAGGAAPRAFNMLFNAAAYSLAGVVYLGRAGSAALRLLSLVATGAATAVSAIGNGAAGALSRVLTMSRGMASALGAGALTLGALGAAFLKTSDDVTLFNRKIAGVADVSSELGPIRAAILQIATTTRSSISSVATDFSKFFGIMKSAGNDIDTTTRMIEGYSLALKMGGASTDEAHRASVQFFQGVAKGKWEMQDLKSLLQTSPLLVKKMAEAFGSSWPVMYETIKKGGDVGQQAMSKILTALANGAGDMKAKFAEMPKTMSESIQGLKNSWFLFVEDVNTKTKFGSGATGIIDQIAAKLRSPALADSVANGINNIVAVAKVAWGVVTSIYDSISTNASAFGTLLYSLFGSAISNATTFANSFGITMTGSIEFVKTAFKTLFDAIGSGLAYVAGMLSQIGSASSLAASGELSKSWDALKGITTAGSEAAAQFRAQRDAVRETNAALDQRQATAAFRLSEVQGYDRGPAAKLSVNAPPSVGTTSTSKVDTLKQKLEVLKDENALTLANLSGERALTSEARIQLEIQKAIPDHLRKGNEELAAQIEKEIRLKESLRERTEMFNRFKTVGEGIGEALGSAFMKVGEGTMKFKDAMKQALVDIIKLTVQALILKPIMQAMGKSMGGFGADMFSGGGASDPGNWASGLMSLFSGKSSTVAGNASNGGWSTTTSTPGMFGNLFGGGNASAGKMNVGAGSMPYNPTNPLPVKIDRTENNWLTQALPGTSPANHMMTPVEGGADVYKAWGSKLNYPTVPGMDNQTVKPIGPRSGLDDSLSKAGDKFSDTVGKSGDTFSGKMGDATLGINESLTGSTDQLQSSLSTSALSLEAAGATSGASIMAGGTTAATSDVVSSTTFSTQVVAAGSTFAATAGSAGAASGGGGIASFFGTLFSANGNAFDSMGKISAFAKGDVFNSPTAFTFGGGKLGVMGEAGPEAVMPLSQSNGGGLGVRMIGPKGSTIAPLTRAADGKLAVSMSNAVANDNHEQQDMSVKYFATGGVFGGSSSTTSNASFNSTWGNSSLSSPVGTEAKPKSGSTGVNVTNAPVVTIHISGDATAETIERMRGMVQDEIAMSRPETIKHSVQAVRREHTSNPNYWKR